MTLRRKIGFILVSVLIVLCLGSFLISRGTVLRAAQEVETDAVTQNLHRVEALIQSEVKDISATNLDWAHWDETYEYTLGHDPQYVERNLVPAFFKPLNISHVFIFDQRGTLLTGMAFDSVNDTPVTMGPDALKQFQDADLRYFTKVSQLDTPVEGALCVDDRIVLVSAYGISDSYSKAPLAGTLIMCRTIDSSMLSEFNAILNGQVTITPVEQGSVIQPSKTGVDIRDVGKFVEASEILMDFRNRPAISATVRQPRETTAEHQGLLNLFLIQLLMLTAAAGLVLAVLLRRFVSKPLEMVASFVRNIRYEHLGENRILRNHPEIGVAGDEYRVLSESIDQMLDRISDDANRIRINEARMKYALDASRAGIWLYRVKDRTVQVDERIEKMIGMGFNGQFVPITYLFDRTEPADHPKLQDAIDRIRNGTEMTLNVECRIHGTSGRYHWYQLAGDATQTAADGSVEVVSGLLMNVDRQKHMEDELRYLSYHDKLTGLYNRRYFEKILKEFDQTAYLPLSVLMGDINGLKLTNDTFGHEAGDELLTAAARAMKKSCRRGDIICRWGGDEFVVLLPNSDEVVAERVYYQIKDACEQETGGPIALHIAMGHATRHRLDEKIVMLIKSAEEHMYSNKAKEAENTRAGILSTILRTLNEKSIETYEHARRIAQMGQQIADHLGLDRGKVEELALLSKLHDIGKIAIPELVLLKESPLTDYEWQMIKSHSEVGYRIVSTLNETAHIAPGVLAHHEHWNGTGYPKGLAGDEIPLIARIIAVADAVDVMRHGRPYREPKSIPDICEELKRCRGRQFDPAVVDVALKILEGN